MKTGLIEALLRLLWNVSGPWGSGESEFLKRVPVEAQVSARNYKEKKKQIVQTKQMSQKETCVNRTETQPSGYMSRQNCESVFTWAVPVSRSWEDNLSHCPKLTSWCCGKCQVGSTRRLAYVVLDIICWMWTISIAPRDTRTRDSGI